MNAAIPRSSIVQESARATGASTGDVTFHRHCQQTVLSAYGVGGGGATWSTIDDLKGSLSNLSIIHSNWINLFESNANMTDDLADILSLIDNVAGKVNSLTPSGGSTDTTWVFEDGENNTIDSKIITWRSGDTYTFRGFAQQAYGRTLTLSFGSSDDKVSYSPIYYGDASETESMDVDIDLSSITKTASFSYAWANESASSLSGLCTSSEQAVKLPLPPRRNLVVKMPKGQSAEDFTV